MTNNNITIGFEVECTVNRDIGSDDLRSYRDTSSDSTVDSNYMDGNRYDPVEIHTVPIRYKSKAFNHFFADIEKLQKQKRITFNSSCGLHFHTRLPDMNIATLEIGCADRIREWQQLIELKYHRLWELRKNSNWSRAFSPTESTTDVNRYKSINLHPAFGSLNTIECRLYGASSSYTIDTAEYKSFVIDTVEWYKQCVNHSSRKNILEDIVAVNTAGIQLYV